MRGRTCMITGASSGIGRATAMALARQGATLVLVCRDRGRGEATVQAIQQETGNRDVTLLLADLSTQAAIRQAAHDFLATDRPLHVLVNNAGIVNLQHQLTTDGIEEVFAVNHLAYFLLTLLLLDRLKASAPARVVNVASTAHRFSGIDFDNLQGERSYRTMNIYGQSKLENIMFTYALARRLDGSGVTVNCLHPGGVGTGLGTNNGAWAQTISKLIRPFMRSPESGALTSIYLASSPQIEGVSGKYFVRCKAKRSSKISYDEAAQRRLWEISARLTGIADSGS